MPRILDLFCGAGGAAMGYHLAGFEVVGVDISPQPRFPFEFVQDDALALLSTFPWWDVPPFQAVHASPPCQRYSDLARRNRNADSHPDLIGPVRELLIETGLPYLIENVEGAPLRDPVLVCGSERGLLHDGYRLRRHRLFESNVPLPAAGCGCAKFAGVPVLDVTGGGPTLKARTDGTGGRPHKGTADQCRAIMGMPWATKTELNEAIPPAYTRPFGEALLRLLESSVASL